MRTAGAGEAIPRVVSLRTPCGDGSARKGKFGGRGRGVYRKYRDGTGIATAFAPRRRVLSIMSELLNRSETRNSARVGTIRRCGGVGPTNRRRYRTSRRGGQRYCEHRRRNHRGGARGGSGRARTLLGRTTLDEPRDANFLRAEPPLPASTCPRRRATSLATRERARCFDIGSFCSAFPGQLARCGQGKGWDMWPGRWSARRHAPPGLGGPRRDARIGSGIAWCWPGPGGRCGALLPPQALSKRTPRRAPRAPPSRPARSAVTRCA